MSATTRPEPPATVSSEPDPTTCPRCGAPSLPQQEYCLTCGLRLPTEPHGVLASLGGAWRRRLRWYPGDWIWVALALLGVAALGAAVAVFASRENTDRAATIIGTSAPGVTTRPAVNTTPATTEPPPTPKQTSPAQQPPPPPPAPRRQRKLLVWPTGQSGWTIVLRSDTSKATADEEARRAIRGGLRDVGVLDSNDYSSLHPGYFVVFTGVYQSQADAEDALDTATSGGYGGAYVRPVSP